MTETNTSIAKVIYILYIVGTIIGLTAVIGLVMAYVNKEEENSWLQTHYRFQVRTFWIGLLYLFIGGLTFQLIIGVFILVCWFFWVIIRCAKGLKQLENQQPVKNLESWFFT